MSVHPSILFFTVVLFSCTGAPEKSVDKMASFRWLTGSWVMLADDITVTEDWKAQTDSSISGSSAFIKKDSVMPFENMQLVYQAGQYSYIVTAANQNNAAAIEFKISSFSDSGFTAENLQHDFPKRIIYRLVNKDSIHAVVDNAEEIPVKKEDFDYTRKKS